MWTIWDKHNAFRLAVSSMLLHYYQVYKPSFILYFLKLAMASSEPQRNSQADTQGVQESCRSSVQQYCLSASPNEHLPQTGDSLQNPEHWEKTQKVNEPFKVSSMQEAGSAEGSFRPSVLDQYQNEAYNPTRLPCQQAQKEQAQFEINKKNEMEGIDLRISRRLTRVSSIPHGSKPTFHQSTNSILHMIASSQVSTQSCRVSLMNSLNEAIKYLARGILLRKCCYNCFKLEAVVLTFSEDFQFVSVFAVEKGMMVVRCMKDFVSVLKGFKTHKFHEYLEKGYELKEQQCFSLMFKERSFDFRAENAQICNDLIAKIQLLHESA